MRKQTAKQTAITLAILHTLLSLMKWMYDFRIKHDFSEASMWDVIFIHIYYMQHSKGMSITALMMARYRRATGYQALRERLDILIRKGIIIQENRRMYPCDKILQEINSLENPEALKMLAVNVA